MNLDNLAGALHATAAEKGFWDPVSRMDRDDYFVFYAKQLAMVHSEVTEVLEALRKFKGEREVVEEMADIIIRVLDLYGGMVANGDLSLSLDSVLEEKSNFNKNRERLHGVAG